IFISKDYNWEMPLQIILYLRGWTDNALRIDRFLSDPKTPQRLLRQEVNKSGKNLVFVAPTLGPKSEAGNLITTTGPDAFLDQVIDAINKHVAHKTVTIQSGGQPFTFDDLGAKLGETDNDDDSDPGEGQDYLQTLVVAAHSGGGTRMVQFLKF